MPPTQVLFFRDAAGRSLVREWLHELRHKEPRVYARCMLRISLLTQLGYELRRPHADYVRNGIFELRVRAGRVNHRILYFFFGANVAVLAHVLTKEAKVLDADIERALARKRLVERNPEQHVLEE